TSGPILRPGLFSPARGELDVERRSLKEPKPEPSGFWSCCNDGVARGPLGPNSARDKRPRARIRMFRCRSRRGPERAKIGTARYGGPCFFNHVGMLFGSCKQVATLCRTFPPRG